MNNSVVVVVLRDEGAEDQEADGGDKDVEDVEVVVLLVPPGRRLKVLQRHSVTTFAITAWMLI